jgi:hypothetical protein
MEHRINDQIGQPAACMMEIKAFLSEPDGCWVFRASDGDYGRWRALHGSAAALGLRGITPTIWRRVFTNTAFKFLIPSFPLKLMGSLPAVTTQTVDNFVKNPCGPAPKPRQDTARNALLKI